MRFTAWGPPGRNSSRGRPGHFRSFDHNCGRLAAAIPAVIAYNLIGASIRDFAARGDDFALEFLNAVERPGAECHASGVFGRGEALMAFTTSNGRTQSRWRHQRHSTGGVVFVLLIIFMVTAPVLQSGIDVSLPRPAR